MSLLSKFLGKDNEQQKILREQRIEKRKKLIEDRKQRRLSRMENKKARRNRDTKTRQTEISAEE